jgi:hypothetical protein
VALLPRSLIELPSDLLGRERLGLHNVSVPIFAMGAFVRRSGFAPIDDDRREVPLAGAASGDWIAPNDHHQQRCSSSLRVA